jgi:DNA-directed RNA polymerase subunit RPC12/RpoP/peptidoglycan/LPS O-acetylase OafA/YrhL
MDKKDNEPVVVNDLEPEILETVKVDCPRCGAEIRASAAEKNNLTCFCCGRKILVRDRVGEKGVHKVLNIHEPLLLPKGSIRALVTLILAISCWCLILRNKIVPSYLFSLILTITAYYFASRKQQTDPSLSTIKRRDDEIGYQDLPLYLPSGVIRFFLISGFVLTGLMSFSQGRLTNLEYLEFFVILTGFIIGYIFSKITAGFAGYAGYNIMNHIKGAVVLIASITVAGLLLSNPSGQNIEYFRLGMCCLISFYFGSKS